MAARLIAFVVAWLHETFPERQIYIRSEGRVQFFTFGPVLQGAIAAMTLMSLGWVAFATVNVIFKDRIIAAKERRFQQWQMASENRIADLQISNGELHDALVMAEDKFKSAADELEAKQDTILDFLGHKRQAETALVGGSALSENINPHAANDAVGTEAIPAPGADGKQDETAAEPEPAPAKPAARKRKSSFLDVGGAVGRIAGALFGKPKPDPLSSKAIARHPVLKRMTAQTQRLLRISAGEAALIVVAEKEAAKGVTELRTILKRTGIKPDGFEQRVTQARGIGGPEIPLDQVKVLGIKDTAFQKAYVNAYATLARLNQLLYGIKHVPLMEPVWGEGFEVSSGFGPRYEPWLRRYAFHPGIDIAGPWGAPLKATAPGTVTWAGPRGTYGKMVEIDHGFSLRTRYGHMTKVLVKVGDKVKMGTVIGKLGSTGRSTGPHVHYEVWYDNMVKNPRNFFKAGRYVLK